MVKNFIKKFLNCVSLFIDKFLAIILLIISYFLIRDYRVDYCNCNSYIFEGNNPIIELRGDFNLDLKNKIIVKNDSNNNKIINVK